PGHMKVMVRNYGDVELQDDQGRIWQSSLATIGEDISSLKIEEMKQIKEVKARFASMIEALDELANLSKAEMPKTFPALTIRQRIERIRQGHAIAVAYDHKLEHEPLPSPTEPE